MGKSHFSFYLWILALGLLFLMGDMPAYAFGIVYSTDDQVQSALDSADQQTPEGQNQEGDPRGFQTASFVKPTLGTVSSTQKSSDSTSTSSASEFKLATMKSEDLYRPSTGSTQTSDSKEESVSAEDSIESVPDDSAVSKQTSFGTVSFHKPDLSSHSSWSSSQPGSGDSGDSGFGNSSFGNLSGLSGPQSISSGISPTQDDFSFGRVKLTSTDSTASPSSESGT